MSRNNNNGSSIGGLILGLAIVGIIIYFIMAHFHINSVSSAVGLVKHSSQKVVACATGKCDSYHMPETADKREAKEDKKGGNEPSVENNSTQEDLDKMASLPVDDSAKIDKKFNPGEWRHWSGKCNTRNVILAQRGTDVKKAEDGCTVLSGKWKDEFTNEVIQNKDQVEMSYIVPLEYADAYGGHEWTDKQKEAFANDKANIAITGERAKEEKEGKTPSQWTPSENTCSFAKKWTRTSDKYGLSISEKDKKILTKELNRCRG